MSNTRAGLRVFLPIPLRSCRDVREYGGDGRGAACLKRHLGGERIQDIIALPQPPARNRGREEGALSDPLGAGGVEDALFQPSPPREGAVLFRGAP